ncbi:MAG: hypothetical protein HOP36_04300 [Methyloglobulus sp.]|nr:hypothetical protein [Methyloglobulus sp.]
MIRAVLMVELSECVISTRSPATLLPVGTEAKLEKVTTDGLNGIIVNTIPWKRQETRSRLATDEILMFKQ